MIDFIYIYKSVVQLYALLMKSFVGGGGGNELSLWFIILLLHGLLCVLTVMSDYTLDEPGFKAPGAPTPAPPSSDSSVETPPEVRRNCVACPRRMSKKRLTVIHYVYLVAGLIVTSIPVAKSAWSGRRRKLDFIGVSQIIKI